jgi:pre-mRNA-splicing factor 18
VQVGLWMMVQHMRERNYLAANDVYLRLAIGNAPWPIGVTSVGIHERSAREKISHVMNQSGQAHIMNDEATRKYFQVGV